ncbi:uncharacterized protein MELLADRAFT_69182 [Melampsora larici-populina 98AG31]|uniref:Uncharacterized protein n=1 Tax=Melampsora larici-populina (strain 98AG31 / pathotype 3-4-7) TaxID=747676 RepID=F4S9P6_MELLP|nr:uncharacterized protein MELLADRAFT_69182 [Melampsora larici-populina 98AG31]EGF98612.1 hypothetical protein MELLADRAFT_69182 [Melampsora larici-populina 98AG31]
MPTLSECTNHTYARTDFPDPDSEAPALNSNSGTCSPSVSGSLTRSVNPVTSTIQENLSASLLPSVATPPQLDSCTNTTVQKKRATAHELDGNLITVLSEKSQAAKSMSQCMTVPLQSKSKAPIKTNDDVPPLIDVSETNWMDSPNPVRDLEEAVEDLRLKLEMNEKSDLSILAEEMRREEEVRLLKVSVAGLEGTIKDFGSLHVAVTNLESQVTRLCGKLSAAVEDIRVQEQVIRQLMSLDEGDEDDSINNSEL